MATATADSKHVFYFGDDTADGDASMKNELGGKGANLAEMIKIGIPVPAGFTIPCDVCIHYSKTGGEYPDGLKEQVDEAIAKIEKSMGSKFGDPANPLLLSCRSGARESMPGMMDTVLNIGLNDQTVEGLAKESGNPQFAYDSYRRLLQMFGDVVLGVEREGKTSDDPFEEILEAKRKAAGVKLDSELSADDLKDVCAQYKQIIAKHGKAPFPQDPMEQVWKAIGAVFGSWDNDRAVVYRRTYGIPHQWGTACNVMAMAFGNLGDDCATGVALTRDGSLGTPGVNGDYLINAQGEDVVAGIRSTKKIEESLQGDMPKAYRTLLDACDKLEKHYKDMQDIEFTIQRGKLWLLQTRNAKRTGFAAVQVAYDLVKEGLITKEQAITKKRIPPDDLNQLLQPIFDADKKKQADAAGKMLTKGLAAGPGAATGKIVFHADDAEKMFNADNDVQLILVRKETTPEDLRGMKAAKGILTELGGTSSHAALVSRQMGKVCIVGASELDIDYKAGTITVGKTTLKEGDDISVDGFTGEIFAGKIDTRDSEVIQALIEGNIKVEDSKIARQFVEIMEWADEFRTLGLRFNGEHAADAKKARAFGATGVGLCRTEHMFFEHITPFRRMILAETDHDLERKRRHAGITTVFIDGDFGNDLITEREKALKELLAVQKADFKELFEAMDGCPVTVRLLDPPLHEFLPADDNVTGQKEAAAAVGKDVAYVQRRVKELHESNPMLGHRGCRLGIVYPEITAMQTRAIMEAACELKKSGVEIKPEIMIPLAGFAKEVENQAAVVRQTADAVLKEQGIDLPYLVGTMIEIPRAALTADEIAETAEFFSFGTNDLTQTCLGMSRDDYGPFITEYRERDIVANDPFAVLDQAGVGQLVQTAVDKGRQTRPDIKLGICGEHGGEPESVKFCHRVGLDYVSCSPFRVPVARLAAAQAVLEEKG